MVINPGDYVMTPRFLRVEIQEVFVSEEAAKENGYTEPTHFEDDDYTILGKVTSRNHMDFAAAHK